MKNLLIASLFLWSTLTQAAPPLGFKGQQDSLSKYPSVVQVPNKQWTETTGGNGIINTGNTNEFANSGFEGTGTSDYVISGVSGGNITLDTTAPLSGKQSLKLVTTGAWSVRQSSTINVAQQDGVQKTCSIQVSSDAGDAQLCSLKAGVEDKCTNSGGYVANSGKKTLTVSYLATSSTSNGCVAKGTASSTTRLDSFVMGDGAPIVNFQQDDVVSAYVDDTGVVTQETGGDWINTVTRIGASAPYRYDVAFKSGYFTSPPNCNMLAGGQSSSVGISASFYAYPTATNFAYMLNNSSGVNSVSSVQIICQKTGADYRSSSAYVASSADFGWTSYTPTYTGLGLATGTARYKRDGEDMLVMFNVTGGTHTGALATISLPSGYTLKNSPATAINNAIVGSMYSSNTPWATNLASANSGSIIYFLSAQTGTGGFAGQAGTTWANGTQFGGEFRVPIQGWEDSGVIVGTFEGHNMTTETFSGNGSTTAFTLAKAPSTINNTQVYINGVYQQKSTYTISGTTLTFSEAPPTGTSNIEVNQALINAAAVPSDGSVTRAKLGTDGIPSVSGITTTNIELSSVSYGTTNTSTNCSGLTACFVDRIGTGISGITNTGTGTYSMTMARTYTKLKCNGNFMISGAIDAIVQQSPMLTCTNCSTLAWATLRRDTAVATNSIGTLTCIGEY
jgi:hypothetical protein